MHIELLAYCMKLIHIVCSLGLAPSNDVPSEMLQVLARAEQIASGEIVYSVQRTYNHKVGAGAKTSELDQQGTRNFEFSFEGTSWSLVQASKHGGKLVNHNGMYFESSETPQADGNVTNSIQIFPATDVDQKITPGPPVFAGTLWYPSTREFLRSNLNLIARSEDVEIDGHICRVFVVSVASKDISAFHVVPSSLVTGGTIRIYSSPDLSYAIPLVEYLNGQGEIVARFRSRTFHEASAGVFVPKSCFYEFPNNSLIYEISRFSRVNESIDQECFVIKVSSDTTIADNLGATTRIFKARDASPQQVKAYESVLPGLSRGYVYFRVFGAITLLCVIGIVVSYFLTRRRSGTKLVGVDN